MQVDGTAMSFVAVAVAVVGVVTVEASHDDAAEFAAAGTVAAVYQIEQELMELILESEPRRELVEQYSLDCGCGCYSS